MSDQMRMLGLNSGLDTETIVSELVKAQSTKKTTLENDKTKLTWKQEIWKDLSSKVKTFYNKSLDNLRWSSSYKKKKTTVGDSKIASVVSSDNAVNGTQTMAVKQLAKSGYLTGGKLSNNGSVGENTTLSELTGGKVAKDAELEFSMKVGDKEKTIKLNGSSTISDMLKEFKDAGINATFDKDNQRIFLSATNSGEKNDFTLTAKNEDSLATLAGAGLLSVEDIKKNSSYGTLAAMYDSSKSASEIYSSNADFKKLVDDKASASAQKMMDGLTTIQETLADLKTKRYELTSERDALADEVTALKEKNTAGTITDEDKAALETKTKELEEINKNLEANESSSKTQADKLAENVYQLKEYYRVDLSVDRDTLSADEKKKYDALNGALQSAKDNTDRIADYTVPTEASKPTGIFDDAQDAAYSEVKTAYNAYTSLETLAGERKAERVLGQDSIIMLNGVDYTSATNSVSVNGLTITAQTESEYSEVTDAQGNVTRKYVETSVNTQDDIDGIYDMIKGFFKEYNDIIKEMDTRYNADRAKGYEPLTDEQKESMSEDEVEKWENKIKDSLLRKDGDLGSAISALKNNMLLSYTIDGKKYSLSNFGIETLSYFSAADNEHGIYHIDGDSDDETTGTNPDKLKALISTNPELVMNFFTQLANGVYQSLDKLMSRTDYRSKYSIYDDKAMKDELTSYDDKIKKQEEYISNLEDRYYDQFTAMEKAMAEVNSKQSALSGLMGY